MTYLPPKFGVSNIGNTNGVTGTVNRGIVFAGGNNITLSQSVNASSATVTISAASQTIQTQNRFNMSLSGNTAGVMAHVSSGTLTLAGGNNITLSQNGNAVTISGGAGGGGIALANSQTTFTSGTANLVASGALTIASTTGQSFNLSVPQTSSLSASGAMSIITNGNTISFGAGNTYSQYDPSPNALGVMATNGQSLHVQPIQAPSFQHDRAYLPIQLSNNNASVGSATVTAWLGLYTRNASTLSLASSSSGSVGITYSGTTNNSTYAGIRNMSIGWTNTVPANDYWIGMVSRTTTGGQNASVSQMLASQINSSFSGDFGVAANATNQFKLGLGYYSATTAGMPTSIGFNEINGSAAGALRPPIVKFISQTA